jgi:hypothetical protein
MEQFIQARIPAGGSYRATDVARQIVADLTESDPSLLTGWLTSRAENMVVRVIGKIRRDRRHRIQKAARARSRQSFGLAVADFENGNPAALEDFLNESEYRVAGQRIIKLGDMDRDDCLFVAENYRSTAYTLGYEAIFMDALAVRVGDQTVRDVLSDEDVHALRDSITRQYQARTA